MPRKNGNGSIATKRWVRKQIKDAPELKNYDSTHITTVTTVGEVINVSDVPAGTLDGDRIGIRIRPIDFEYRCRVTLADTDNIVRIIVFQDLSANGADPAPNNLIVNTFDMYNNINVPSRFRIVSDRTARVDDLGARTAFIHSKGKLHGVQTFNEGSALPFQNSTFLLLMSDSGAIADPLVTMEMRIRYTDA